jgi:ectoine hydroxylase-related dioxygenase (phytanoyl-CoA dioxygenase family)
LKSGSCNDTEPFYMYNSSARNPLKGNTGQQIHVDSNLPGINYPLIINALWYLEKSDQGNGATIVIPDTLKTKKFAEDGKTDYPNKITVEADAGDVLLFDANIWHGGGPNINGLSRWAAAVGYARWFIKPSFDTIRNTPVEIFDKLSERQKRLLGFDLNPPRDEFERLNRRSKYPEDPRQ